MKIEDYDEKTPEEQKKTERIIEQIAQMRHERDYWEKEAMSAKDQLKRIEAYLQSLKEGPRR